MFEITDRTRPFDFQHSTRIKQSRESVIGGLGLDLQSGTLDAVFTHVCPPPRFLICNKQRWLSLLVEVWRLNVTVCSGLLAVGSEKGHAEGLLLNEETNACARLDTQILVCFDKQALKTWLDLNANYETCHHHYPMMDKEPYFLVFTYTYMLPHREGSFSCVLLLSLPDPSRPGMSTCLIPVSEKCIQWQIKDNSGNK